MIYGLYLSSAGMITQRHRLDVIANNLANVNTTSFKRDVAAFRTRAPESHASGGGLQWRAPVLDGQGGGTFVGPSFTEFAPGEVEVTGRALDVYLKGPGLLPVAGDDGQVAYTRDGRLTIDGQDQLVLAATGRPVLGATGAPITIDRTRPTTISPAGEIKQDGETVALLSVAVFDDPTALRKVGENLYANPSGAEPVSARADVVAGALEKSTVSPVEELAGMIEAQRAYEANAAVVRLQDQTLGDVINTLPRNI